MPLHEAQLKCQDEIGGAYCCQDSIDFEFPFRGMTFVIELPSFSIGVGRCKFCGKTFPNVRGVRIMRYPNGDGEEHGNWLMIGRIDIDEKPIDAKKIEK